MSVPEGRQIIGWRVNASTKHDNKSVPQGRHNIPLRITISPEHVIPAPQCMSFLRRQESCFSTAKTQRHKETQRDWLSVIRERLRADLIITNYELRIINYELSILDYISVPEGRQIIGWRVNASTTHKNKSVPQGRHNIPLRITISPEHVIPASQHLSFLQKQESCFSTAKTQRHKETQRYWLSVMS